MRKLFNAALILSAGTVVYSFAPTTFLTTRPPTATNRFPTYQQAGSDNANNDPLAHNMARTCVKNFLTQRAIQSFMFLLYQCRDQPTVNWLHDAFGWKNLLSFHGTGAFNMTKYGTWDSVLTDMMSRPPDTVVVSVVQRAGRGRGGWSKNNPYLEEGRLIDFTIDIDPVSLASRILSVREQLAAEWEHDFDTIIYSNNLILTSYFDKVMDARDDEAEFDPEAEVDEEEDHEKPEHDLDPKSLTAPYSAPKPEAAFDRKAMQTLLDETAFETVKSSPLRKGNFDLMILLSTQESVHRVLRQYKEYDKELQFEWLLDFYTQRLETYFDGSQNYGRADDFLEELLLTPPSVKKVDGTVGLTDPLGVAEDIIRIRGEVCREWKEAMAHVKLEHTELRRLLLAHQMGEELEPQAEKSEGGGSFE